MDKEISASSCDRDSGPGDRGDSGHHYYSFFLCRASFLHHDNLG